MAIKLITNFVECAISYVDRVNDLIVVYKHPSFKVNQTTAVANYNNHFGMSPLIGKCRVDA